MSSRLPHDKITVVVAEDQLLVRMFAVDFLDDAGFKVFEACHADDALLLLQARPDVQVLITDVEMDGGSMNGFELARQARERWPLLGIVVVSGRAAPNNGDLPEGAVFIAKPYRPATILNAIQSMVAKTAKSVLVHRHLHHEKGDGMDAAVMNNRGEAE